MAGKVWATSLLMLVVILVSLFLVVRGMLHLKIAGSLPLFFLGVLLYLFAASSIGIFLATLARSMPQMGLLVIMVVPPMNQLSGNNTPLESQPIALQALMQMVPTTHFVKIAHAVIFRGAEAHEIWLSFVALLGLGVAIFSLALIRFRRSMAAARG